MGDAIENLFSQVRHKNPVPTTAEFSNNLRSITLSQYLAVKKSTSYGIDHESYFLLDFFSPSKNSKNMDDQDDEPMNCVTNQECSNEEIDSDNESNFEMLDTIPEELSKREEQSLYCMGGSVLNKIKFRKTWCDDCLAECVAENPLLEVMNQTLPANFTHQKDFTGHALNYPSDKLYRMLLIMEREVRFLEENGKCPDSEVMSFLEKHIEPFIKDFLFKDCHRIKHKFVHQYLKIRIFNMARKRRTEIKEKTSRNQCRDSRSMFMRHAVDHG